ncbi:MAG: MBL fold metallo-hydrolase [Desulfobacteraceae bacterium]|nr:MAG: MBL fold metallo-hydrolase [Desulfobacteraceae bacterium]
MQTFEEIRPGIRVATLPLPGKRPGPVNVYLFEGERNVLVDTGARQTAHLLKSIFRNSGFDLNNLDQIIATHGHLDHFGAAAQLIRCSNKRARLAAHPEDVPSILHRREATFAAYVRYFGATGVPILLRILMLPLMFLGKYMAEPCPVDHLLNDGDKVRLGDYEAVVISTPGHTCGSICLYIQSEKILVAGDHILEHITPNALVMLENNGSLPQRSSQMEYYRSLEKVLRLSPELVLTAHGKPVRDIGRVVDRYRESFGKRKERVLDIIGHEKKTVYRIARELFPELGGMSFPLDLFLALSEAYTHLQVLEKEGKIAMAMEGRRLQVGCPDEKRIDPDVALDRRALSGES